MSRRGRRGRRAGGAALAAGACAGGGYALYRRRTRAVAADPVRNLTGAPFPLGRVSRRRGAGTGSARLLDPRWEPPLLRAAARWEPGPPRPGLRRAMAYAWASPVTLVGLLVGATTRVRPEPRDGVLVFARAGGLAGAVLRRTRYDAVTFGHVVVARGVPSPSLMAHELIHTRHAERLGPLTAPVHLGLLAVYGYARHPLERAARRAARRALGAPV